MAHTHKDKGVIGMECEGRERERNTRGEQKGMTKYTFSQQHRDECTLVVVVTLDSLVKDDGRKRKGKKDEEGQGEIEDQERGKTEQPGKRHKYMRSDRRS